RKEMADFLARSKAIDASGLPEPDRLDRDLLIQTLSGHIESIRLKTYLMPIDQMNGVHLGLPQIATVAPFDSGPHYRDYIARLNAIPNAIDQVIELSRAGLREGLIQPKFLLEKTIPQCAAIAEAAGEASPFAEPAKRIPESIPVAERKQIHDDIITAVDQKI